MYDVTRKDTFTGLDGWLNELEVYTSKNSTVKMLVGNKTDKVSLEMHPLALLHSSTDFSVIIEYKCEISSERNKPVVLGGGAAITEGARLGKLHLLCPFRSKSC